MKVRELMAMLCRCSPESTVVCEARSEALLVIGRRTGMHEAWPDEPRALTIEDEDLLCALRIRNAR